MVRYERCERTQKLRRLLKLQNDTLHIQGWLRLSRGLHTAQIWVCVKRALKLLGVDLPILVQNVGIHAGDHVDLSVSSIALSGLQVAVVQLQLIGGAGMAEGVKDHFWLSYMDTPHRFSP